MKREMKRRRRTWRRHKVRNKTVFWLDLNHTGILIFLFRLPLMYQVNLSEFKIINNAHLHLFVLHGTLVYMFIYTLLKEVNIYVR